MMNTAGAEYAIVIMRVKKKQGVGEMPTREMNGE
jgi:hypothetical protein